MIKNMKRKSLTIKLILLVFIILFIWTRSMKPATASDEESGRIMQMIAPLLEIFVGKGNVTMHLVRKLAHMAEFAILGMDLKAIMAELAALRMDLKAIWNQKQVVLVEGMKPVSLQDELAVDKSDNPKHLVPPGVWMAFLCGIPVAVIDELIQLFAPGRSCEFKDILIDCAGLAIGVLIMWGIEKIISNRTSGAAD